jgi:hypothetical protein
MTEKDPREDKLPKWAQDQLTTLRRQAAELEQVVTTLQGEHPGSNVRVGGGNSRTNLPLPRNAYIDFKGQFGWISVYHDRDGQVCVQGERPVILTMTAANRFKIKLEG